MSSPEDESSPDYRYNQGLPQNNGHRHGTKRVRRESTSNPRLPTSRRRTACQSCRARKVKCDQLHPCGFCKSSGGECVYLNNATDKLMLDPATKFLAKRLDQIAQSIEGISSSISRNEDPSAIHRQTSLQSNPSPRSQPISTIEPSRDHLQIPSQRTTADTVLIWPIFRGRYEACSLIQSLFASSSHSNGTNSSHVTGDDLIAKDLVVVPGGLLSIPDEKIPSLVDSFLQNVNTKNPILDVEALVQHGRKAAENGLGWGAPSCLVLLACALGSIARPFDQCLIAAETMSRQGPPSRLLSHEPVSSATIFAKDLQQAESCYVLACRRIGLLKFTILGAQCHFFAGVYLMYTLRPVAAWNHFHQASMTYQLYLRLTCAPHGGDTFSPNIQHLSLKTKVDRRLEQSLYWSCFKSECEFRVELPLPQSEIADFDYPNLFPSPPSPAATDLGHQSTRLSVLRQINELGFDHALDSSETVAGSPILQSENIDIRHHSKRLCNEEESWYYYLTEIALRRIGNRIINTFYRQDHCSWMDIKPLISIALEFDAQVSAWSANLPPAMQQYETSFSIRAPRFDSPTNDRHRSASKELSWATENRLLEMRSWLYQPFLYYTIHIGCMSDHSNPVTQEMWDSAYLHEEHNGNTEQLLDDWKAPLHPQDAAVLQTMIVSGVECNLQILDARSLLHRHHGLWFDLRAVITSSIILLALVKSNNAKLIPGGPEVLFGSNFRAVYVEEAQRMPAAAEYRSTLQGGKLKRVLDALSFWEEESLGLKEARKLLEGLAGEVLAGLMQQ